MVLIQILGALFYSNQQPYFRLFRRLEGELVNMMFLLKLYSFLFARKSLYKLHKLLYYCSLSGLGILNSSNDKTSGEAHFVKTYYKNKPTGVVLDVGANIGSYSKNLLELNPNITLYAFEPHPLTFQKLKENIIAENFHAINAAVGAVAGVLSLYDYQDNDGSSHASLYQDVIENLHNAKATEHQVNVITLGDFIESNNIDKISLLKIDTEGNELNVLKGAINQLKQGRISVIHFEFNEMNVASRTYFMDFWNLLPNYDFYRLLPNDMIKIDKYKPVFCEIFAFQNIVAILRK